MSEDEVDLVSLRRRFAGFQISFANQNLYLGEILLVLKKDITYKIKVVRNFIFFLNLITITCISVHKALFIHISKTFVRKKTLN